MYDFLRGIPASLDTGGRLALDVGGVNHGRRRVAAFDGERHQAVTLVDRIGRRQHSDLAGRCTEGQQSAGPRPHPGNTERHGAAGVGGHCGNSAGIAVIGSGLVGLISRCQAIS